MHVYLRNVAFPVPKEALFLADCCQGADKASAPRSILQGSRLKSTPGL